MPEHRGTNGAGQTTRLTQVLKAGLAPPEPATPPAPPAPPAAAGSGGPAAPQALGDRPGDALPVDFTTITDLRKRASERIDIERKRRDGLSEADEQQLARAVVAQLVAEWAPKYAMSHPALTREQEAAVGVMVFDALYRAGAVQRYLDDPDVENIKILGDQVRVKYFNRATEVVPPVTDDEAGLLKWINDMAARSGHRERQLSKSRPLINFRLPDGSRVAASLITQRLSVAIRRHRILHHSLDDLIGWGTIDPVLAAFLTACVRAKCNLLIAGEMGVGKTSLLRALARTIPAHEDIVTIESDRELYLEQMPDGPHVLAFEARESGGERGDGGQMLGAITVADIVPEALRYDVSRVIVGEVRSVEIVPMLDAMVAGGSGSMCTLHARGPGEVLDRLLSLCNRAQMSDQAASKLVATSVDFVVYLEQIDQTAQQGGRRWRFASHVLENTGMGESGRPTFSPVFAPASGNDPRAVPAQPPTRERLNRLVAKGGFDPQWLQHRRGMWAAAGEKKTAVGS